MTANSTICDLFVKINLMNLKAKSILLENNFVQINENIFGYSLISYFDYVEDLFNDGLIETAIMKEYAFKYYKYLE